MNLDALITMLVQFRTSHEADGAGRLKVAISATDSQLPYAIGQVFLDHSQGTPRVLLEAFVADRQTSVEETAQQGFNTAFTDVDKYPRNPDNSFKKNG